MFVLFKCFGQVGVSRCPTFADVASSPSGDTSCFQFNGGIARFADRVVWLYGGAYPLLVGEVLGAQAEFRKDGWYTRARVPWGRVVLAQALWTKPIWIFGEIVGFCVYAVFVEQFYLP